MPLGDPITDSPAETEIAYCYVTMADESKRKRDDNEEEEEVRMTNGRKRSNSRTSREFVAPH